MPIWAIASTIKPVVRCIPHVKEISRSLDVKLYVSVTLFGNSVFPDVIKLEWSLIRVSPNPIGTFEVVLSGKKNRLLMQET